MTTEVSTATRVLDGREVPIAGTWTIDPAHTDITFEARHMMITKVRGSFADASGTVVVADDPLESTVEVTVDVASVDSGSTDRDNHLKSPDFFDVENHPEISFRSTGVEPAGEGYRLTGDLTIRDVTRRIVIDFEFAGGLIDPFGNTRVAFSARFEADREDWGLTWNMPLETGGVLVGKKITVYIDTALVKVS